MSVLKQVKKLTLNQRIEKIKQDPVGKVFFENLTTKFTDKPVQEIVKYLEDMTDKRTKVWKNFVKTTN